MEKQALLYIVTPIALLFIVYLLVVTISWPMARRHTFVPFYLLLLLVLFPPAFIFFIFWFYIIHLGFLTSIYYIRDPSVQEIQTVPQSYSQQGTLSQRERRMSGSSRV
mgnify:CR=1 FL=1